MLFNLDGFNILSIYKIRSAYACDITNQIWDQDQYRSISPRRGHYIQSHPTEEPCLNYGAAYMSLNQLH